MTWAHKSVQAQHISMPSPDITAVWIHLQDRILLIFSVCIPQKTDTTDETFAPTAGTGTLNRI
jgi:hypothetical protein